jgi:hypothetical protein
LWFDAAVGLLPAYAPAEGHLGEVEAELGDADAAIARLLPLTTSSDDPDYAGALARISGAQAAKRRPAITAQRLRRVTTN